MKIALYAVIETGSEHPPDLPHATKALTTLIENVGAPDDPLTVDTLMVGIQRTGLVKMDKKFFGAIFKAKNGQLLQDDEYVVFLTKDDCFVEALDKYQTACVEHGCDDDQVREVEKLVDRVDGWRAYHESALKKPDAHGETLLP